MAPTRRCAEGAEAWTAQQVAEEAARQARQAEEAVRSRGGEIVMSLNRQIDELTILRERLLREAGREDRGAGGVGCRAIRPERTGGTPGEGKHA